MDHETGKAGVLFIVATPIGNLEDISERALRTLRGVDQIAAEDTRHSARLLKRYQIPTPVRPYHEHNEARQTGVIMRLLQAGSSVALISDAGTPLISDPGYRLVRACQDHGIQVASVPGPSAVIAALSVSGLPTDRFAFEGFLPAKKAALASRLRELQSAEATLVFFEAPHRIVGTLHAMAEVFGGDREAAVARELTKRFETVRRASLGELRQWIQEDPDRRRGEFVVLVRGADAEPERDGQGQRALAILMQYLPLKQAVEAAARVTGDNKNALYRRALALKDCESPE